MSAKPAGAAQRGFTYLAVLIAVAVIGALGAGALTAGATLQRRAAEDELLFIGAQFQAAFRIYYEASPNGSKRYPNDLGDLLRDPRYPMPRRYLRKIFADPLTGRTEWGIVRAPEGGIMGVYSLSTETPIKRANFPVEQAEFEGKDKYSEWVFYHAPFQSNNGMSPNRDGRPVPASR